jgi:hypothetical protein
MNTVSVHRLKGISRVRASRKRQNLVNDRLILPANLARSQRELPGVTEGRRAFTPLAVAHHPQCGLNPPSLCLSHRLSPVVPFAV